jgi:hypothetical protein
MDVQLPEDLCRVEQVVLLENPTCLCQPGTPPPIIAPDSTYFFPFHAKRGRLRISATQYPLMRNRKVRKA